MNYPLGGFLLTVTLKWSGSYGLYYASTLGSPSLEQFGMGILALLAWGTSIWLDVQVL